MDRSDANVTNGEIVTGRGFHLALSREETKQLMARPEGAAVRQFVLELEAVRQASKSDLLLSLGNLWDAMHRSLTEGELDPLAGEFPLNHAILGGKPLCQDDGFLISFVRPDMTPFIAEAIAHLKRDDFRQRYFQLDPTSYQREPNQKEYESVWNALQRVRDFYEAAAEDRTAVLFAAEL